MSLNVELKFCKKWSYNHLLSCIYLFFPKIKSQEQSFWILLVMSLKGILKSKTGLTNGKSWIDFRVGMTEIGEI